jgi:hypothetical protein
MKIRTSFVSNSSSSSFIIPTSKEVGCASDLINKYPIRNKETRWVPLDAISRDYRGFFTVWPMKDRLILPWPPLDPWNRRFPSEGKYMSSGAGWDFDTTVEGSNVVCKIFKEECLKG